MYISDLNYYSFLTFIFERLILNFNIKHSFVNSVLIPLGGKFLRELLP